MKLAPFIDSKGKQLCYYLRAFWSGVIPHDELDLFFWDTLEEWSLIKNTVSSPYTQRERVFWHILHQVHYWSEEQLKRDTYLRDELENCLQFIEGKGFCPFDCIGIRP